MIALIGSLFIALLIGTAIGTLGAIFTRSK
jgi:hypothetical protein